MSWEQQPLASDNDSCFVVIVYVAFLVCGALLVFALTPVTHYAIFPEGSRLGIQRSYSFTSHERINCVSSFFLLLTSASLDVESTSPYLPLIGFLECHPGEAVFLFQQILDDFIGVNFSRLGTGS